MPRPFWVLWAGILINRLGTVVEPFLGVYLVAARGFPVERAGQIMGVYAAGALVAQIMGGVLADRLGRRATLNAGMLANGAALIALGYATGTIAIVVTAFAAGATVDLYRPAAQALVADLVPAADRARAYGLISWAANLGFTAAMLTGGGLAQAGFRWLFGADALSCAIFALLAWHALPETHGPDTAAERTAGFVLRDPVLAAFLLVVLAHMIVYQQGFTTLPIAMHADRLPPSAYGLAMAVNGLVIIVLQPLAISWLSVGHDVNLVLVAAHTLMGGGFALTALAHSTLAYAAAASVWTLGEIAMAIAGSAIVADLAPARLRVRYLGSFGAACALGALLAPLIGTQLLELDPAGLWMGCGALASAAAAGQISLTPAMRRRTHRPG